MMRIRAVVLGCAAVLLGTGAAAQAPTTGVVQGTVRAASSGEPVAGAAVQVLELGREARTDRDGRFRLAEVPLGRWRVRAVAPGFAPAERVVTLPASGELVVELTLPARPIALQGLEVRGEPRAAHGAGPGALRIEPEVVRALPAAAEPDVLQALQLLPSVQAASDFSSAPYVRGGSPDQNLLLLDGAPLFNPYHLGGVFGAFDPAVVAAVDVLPGAFPARLGDRLSSVIEVRTREGRRDRVHGSGGLGLISSRASLDGPLPGGRGSFLVSARRTYLDAVVGLGRALRLSSGRFPYAFTDAHLKLDRDVGRGGQLTASLYLNDEQFRIPQPKGFDGTARFDWGSRLGSLRYRHTLAPNLVAELRLAATGFGGRFLARDRPCTRDPDYPEVCVYTDDPAERDTLVTTLQARTRMTDLLAGTDVVWYGARHELHAGLQVDAYRLEHDLRVAPYKFDDLVPNLWQRQAPRTLAAYVEDEWRPSDRLRLRGGLRVLEAGDAGTAWMPRLGAEYELTPSVSLALGGGRYAQALHTLRNEESVVAGLIAYDLLRGATAGTGLSIARDLAAGVTWQPAAATLLRLDAYRRAYDRVPVPPPALDALDAPILVSDSIQMGTERAHGLELLALHSRGRAQLTLSYALSFAEMRLGETRYPPRFQRRHVLDALLALPAGERGQVGIRLAAASGQPYTPVAALIPRYDHDPATGAFLPGQPADWSFVPGAHNSARLPAYLRLDLGWRKDYERRWFGRAMTVTPYAQVLNALGSRNVLAAAPEGDGRGQAVLRFLPQLPILPSFGVEWTF